MAAPSVNSFKFEFAKPTRLNTALKFDYYFATQYKQCYVYFGISSDKSAIEGECKVMSGTIAMLVDGVDREDKYLWSYMPQLKQGECICGGYACGEEINLYTKSDPYALVKCWAVSLSMPSSCWSEFEKTPSFIPTYSSVSAIKQCQQYIVCFSETYFTITDTDTHVSASFSTTKCDRYSDCAVIGADMFIVTGNKMAILENFAQLLTVSTEQTVIFDHSIPHDKSSLFVVKDTLCVIGGCDKDGEPFSDIYQFDLSKKEWNECGFASVSRFGTSVVVFTDDNQKQAVFVAGGFKGKDMPCSIIEKLSVIVKT